MQDCGGRASHVWRAENGIAKVVFVKIMKRLDVVKREMVDLRPEWIGDLNRACNREEWDE